MRPPRISNFPLHKPFEKQDATTPLSEIAMRLVVNFYSGEPCVIGTGTVITGNLLVSAKHVFDVFWKRRSALEIPSAEFDESLVALQILPGAEYVIWDVVGGWAHPMSDLMFLRLGSNPGRSHPEKPYVWRGLRVNPFSPEIGESIAAFGYRRSEVIVSKNSAGGNHIELNDEPMMSVGVVREIHPMQRDTFILPFPCYQVSARFDSGMSGGPVFDETGCLCGLVSSSIEGADLEGEPISYVTILWPLFSLIISADRGDHYPRGISYPAIELARDGQISVAEIDRLNMWFASGRL